jgi:hypothetical protein
VNRLRALYTQLRVEKKLLSSNTLTCAPSLSNAISSLSLDSIPPSSTSSPSSLGAIPTCSSVLQPLEPDVGSTIEEQGEHNTIEEEATEVAEKKEEEEEWFEFEDILPQFRLTNSLLIFTPNPSVLVVSSNEHRLRDISEGINRRLSEDPVKYPEIHSVEPVLLTRSSVLAQRARRLTSRLLSCLPTSRGDNNNTWYYLRSYRRQPVNFRLRGKMENFTAGGKRHLGENSLEAALRELEEETTTSNDLLSEDHLLEPLDISEDWRLYIVTPKLLPPSPSTSTTETP